MKFAKTIASPDNVIWQRKRDESVYMFIEPPGAIASRRDGFELSGEDKIRTVFGAIVGGNNVANHVQNGLSTSLLKIDLQHHPKFKRVESVSEFNSGNSQW